MSSFSTIEWRKNLTALGDPLTLPTGSISGCSVLLAFNKHRLRHHWSTPRGITCDPSPARNALSKDWKTGKARKVISEVGLAKQPESTENMNNHNNTKKNSTIMELMGLAKHHTKRTSGMGKRAQKTSAPFTAVHCSHDAEKCLTESNPSKVTHSSLASPT